jgi:hypothetical protein
VTPQDVLYQRVQSMLLNMAFGHRPVFEVMTAIMPALTYLNNYRISDETPWPRLPPPKESGMTRPDVYVFARASTAKAATRAQTDWVGSVDCGECANCKNRKHGQVCLYRGLYDVWDMRHCDVARGEWPIIYGVFSRQVIFFSEYGDTRRTANSKDPLGRIVQ